MVLKLKNWFMGLNIRHKILILFYGIVVITSLLIVFFSYTISINQLKKEVGNSLLRDTKRIAASIDFLQRDVNELSSFLVLDQRIQNFISPHSDFTKYSLGPLASLLASKDYISFIALYSFQGDKYYFSNDSSTLIMDLELIKRTSFYREVLEKNGAPMWLSLENLPFDLIIKNNYPKIAMARVLLDFNTYKPEGLLVICINIPTIEKVYSENLKEKESAFFIADRNGNIISFKSTFSGFTPKSAQNILAKYLKDKQNVVININSSKLLVTSSPIPTSDWRLVSVVSLKNAINSIRISFIEFYLRILVFCLLFAFLVSMYFSRALTHPLERLANSMKKVRQGNLEEKVEFEYHSKDEIAIVIKEYNRMVERINDLINRILKLEINKREAELKALEAQINPHFLYNTLDTIFWKAEKAKDRELSEMICSLSRLFRLTLNRGEEFIQVRGEKELIERYLFLQSKRYKNKFKYSVKISDEILDYYIPKLILQPFVENAIVHGLENNSEESFVEVIGEKEGENLKFIIKDNGPGMSEETLEKLKRFIESENIEEKVGYAIRNVNERLRLYYGDKYELKIESRQGEGTTISLILPESIS